MGDHTTNAILAALRIAIADPGASALTKKTCAEACSLMTAAPPQQVDVEALSALARVIVPPDTTNDGCPWYSDRQAILNSGAFEAVRYLHQHPSALFRPPKEVGSYAMSRDYEALYDHLCAGGTTFASVTYTLGDKDAKLLHAPVETTMGFDERAVLDFGRIYTTVEDPKAEFLKHCERMDLEWLAPSTLTVEQVMEVVDEYVPGKVMNDDLRSRLASLFASH